MQARKKLLLLCLSALLGGSVFTGCGSSDGAGSSTADENENSGILTLESAGEIDEIYTTDDQTNVSDELRSLRESGSYTLDSPLIVAEPYGTNTPGLYLWFTTDTPATISYTVSAEGCSDFPRELYGDSSTEHEYLLIGIVPYTLNTITLTTFT